MRVFITLYHFRAFFYYLQFLLNAWQVFFTQLNPLEVNHLKLNHWKPHHMN